KISRQQKNQGNECQLSVEQIYINLANRKHKTPLKHKIGAVINCKNNDIASPVNWDLTSEFLEGPEDIEEFKRADSLRESVTVEGDELVITANNRTFRRKVSNKLTADWNLFNAVQLLPFDKNIDIKFDFLEGLRAFREKHYLYYKGKIRDKWGTKTVNFHCFEHLGSGVLPYEYWVTENHRLALVITGNRAYILKES
ncbi:hypothetical protein KAS50_08805, partial [bacterium]|nr:hypothetical protein [bacterium]